MSEQNYEEKTMSQDEALLFLADELEDEQARGDAYRDAAITLLDHIAEQAAQCARAKRQERRERDDELMNMHVPMSTSTH